MKRTLLLSLLVWGTPLAAVTTDDPVYMDIRLMGADLVDDLVFSWLQDPPFKEHALVTVADVSAPIGLDDRFRVLVENRLYEVVIANPRIRLSLVHCSVCNQLVAKSNADQTTIGRGIDQPEVLDSLLKVSPDRRALSLQFEAEGRELRLRAQIFELFGDQRILWAKTFSTAMTSRRALRDAAPLVSLQSARETQRKILNGRDQIEATTRITVRTFSVSGGANLGGASTTAPLLFLEQSFEGVLLPDRRRRVAATFGAASIKDNLSAWSAGGSLMQLLWSQTPHLYNPDLYWFLGFHYVRLRGLGALPFADKQLDLNRVRNETAEPKASMVTWRLGLEAHMKHRFGMLVFLEYIPELVGSEVIEERRFLVPYHSVGAGWVVRW